MFTWPHLSVMILLLSSVLGIRARTSILGFAHSCKVAPSTSLEDRFRVRFLPSSTLANQMGKLQVVLTWRDARGRQPTANSELAGPGWKQQTMQLQSILGEEEIHFDSTPLLLTLESVLEYRFAYRAAGKNVQSSVFSFAAEGPMQTRLRSTVRTEDGDNMHQVMVRARPELADQLESMQVRARVNEGTFHAYAMVVAPLPPFGTPSNGCGGGVSTCKVFSMREGFALELRRGDLLEYYFQYQVKANYTFVSLLAPSYDPNAYKQNNNTGNNTGVVEAQSTIRSFKVKEPMQGEEFYATVRELDVETFQIEFESKEWQMRPQSYFDAWPVRVEMQYKVNAGDHYTRDDLQCAPDRPVCLSRDIRIAGDDELEYFFSYSFPSAASVATNTEILRFVQQEEVDIMEAGATSDVFMSDVYVANAGTLSVHFTTVLRGTDDDILHVVLFHKTGSLQDNFQIQNMHPKNPVTFTASVLSKPLASLEYYFEYTTKSGASHTTRRFVELHKDLGRPVPQLPAASAPPAPLLPMLPKLAPAALQPAPGGGAKPTGPKLESERGSLLSSSSSTSSCERPCPPTSGSVLLLFGVLGLAVPTVAYLLLAKARLEHAVVEARIVVKALRERQAVPLRANNDCDSQCRDISSADSGFTGLRFRNSPAPKRPLDWEPSLNMAV